MFFRLINFIRGYVVILVKGLFPERFINLCSKNNIELWNIRKKSKNTLTAHIGIKNFKRLRKTVKNSGCQVHIVKKHGLRFFIHRHRRRKALLIGLTLFFALLYVMTKFVWIIEITGNSKVADADILNCVGKAGLRTGMPAVKVDSDNIKNYIMSNMAEISFVTVNRKGTTVTIDVREREEKPKHFDKQSYSNIIASQSGVIESILVQSGTAAVKKGDVVYKGQLLVSGAADNSHLGIKYSNSDADIKARVWHEKTVELPYYIEEKTYTDNVKYKRILKFFDFSVNLSLKNKILFEKYDILSYTNYISLGKDKILPIGIETICCKEYKITKTKLNEEQAKDAIFKELEQEYKESEIVNRTYKVKDNKLTVTFECIEEIGHEEAINDNGKISGS